MRRSLRQGNREIPRPLPRSFVRDGRNAQPLPELAQQVSPGVLRKVNIALT
ncbi:hypothetical protein [Marinobacter alexandrii]|uniref:hypothetical protein n=1 Tax=Marinobacter alexandrii TaxID=2570351 RepID=UPI0032980416